jgi:organic radical activating enzyme
MNFEKIKFPDEVSFYICNLCNLTCEGCLTHSNRRFKGSFKWETHADEYKQWSKVLSFYNISILGGEPFLNTDLFEWCKNLKELWPECNELFIDTNGTQLKNNIELSKELINMGWVLRVACHDPSHYQEIESVIEEILKDRVDLEKNDIIDVLNLKARQYVSNGKLLAQLGKQWYFFPSYIKNVSNGVTYFHDLDPELNHKNCPVNDCYVFVNGLLYKCMLVATYPEAKKQFKFEKAAGELLDAYRACSSNDSIDEIIKFIDKLPHTIEQCKLCPYSEIPPPPNTPRTIKLFPLSKTKPII